MATKFIEPGSAATFNLSLYGGTTSVGSATAPANSSQAVALSPYSIKCLVTAGASDVSSFYTPAGVLTDAGTRISAYFRFSAVTPGQEFDFMNINTSGGVACFNIGLTTANLLCIRDSNYVVQATGVTVLAANTDYRISVVYSITSASVNTISVYINGILEIVVSNITVLTASNTLVLGLPTPLIAMSLYVAHVYIDNSTSGVDPGDVRVTAKRPYSNGTTNNFATTGSGSGYPASGGGNAPYVNIRPPSSAAYVSVTPTTVKTEEYNIETVSQGDINISGYTILDFMGWISAEVASTSNSPVMKIILAGTSTTKTLSTSFAYYTQIAGSTTYPTGNTDIGMSAQYTTTGHKVSMDGCGVIVAFLYPSVTTKTLTGVARITIVTAQTLLGKARITITSTQTLLGKARITIVTTKTLAGKARITISTLQTLLGKARITITSMQTLLGKARITIVTTKTLIGKANITATNSQILTGKAYIISATPPPSKQNNNIAIPSITSAIPFTNAIRSF